MKTSDALCSPPFWLVVAALYASLPGSRAGTLALWDFNTNPPDPTNSFTTGSLMPVLGAGTASLLGGATSTFASGNVNGGSSDPTTIDDSAWNTTSYPAQGTLNKTRGVQFNVSTLGFERIVVSWDQRHSDGSSRYLRFQYSTNGTDFVDGPGFSAARTTAGQERFDRQSVDLTSHSGVNNKSNFAFRIVAEFESTAVGNDTNRYAPTLVGGTYLPSGTWRFDMVTVAGEVFSGNEFPSISAISNVTMRINVLSDEIPFVIGDFETPAEELQVVAHSSDLVLLPNENIFLLGTDSNRAVRVFPASDRSGTVRVTLTVSDGIGNTTSTSFLLTVLPDNTAPILSGFSNGHVMMNTTSAPIAFTVGDAESPAEDLSFAVQSSNPTLIPETNLLIDGSGSNRTLTITPALEQVGNAVITITVDDGFLATSRSFSVMVLPSAAVVLCEPFDYPDGAIVPTSAFRWSKHSGIEGQTQVSAGELRLVSSQSQTEDISAALIGGPFAANSGKRLYAAFTVNFKTLPTGFGEFFAHFREVSENGLRGRIFGTVSNAAPGTYRLAIGNVAQMSASASEFPVDLALETEYLVVVRYDLATATSTLWVNPRSEGNTNVTATDSASLASIFAWSFRQSNVNGNMGTLHIDDLKVGFSFSDVVPGYRLRIRHGAAGVEVSWPAAATDEGYALESTMNLNAATWPRVDTVWRNGLRDSITNSPSGAVFYRLAK